MKVQEVYVPVCMCVCVHGCGQHRQGRQLLKQPISSERHFPGQNISSCFRRQLWSSSLVPETGLMATLRIHSDNWIQWGWDPGCSGLPSHLLFANPLSLSLSLSPSLPSMCLSFPSLSLSSPISPSPFLSPTPLSSRLVNPRTHFKRL